MASYFHLRVHTEYCITKSTLRLDELIASAKADGQGALAITDTDNLFGALRFYNACRSAGIKPIIGIETGLTFKIADAEPAESVKCILLCKSFKGYQSLMQALSKKPNPESPISISDISNPAEIFCLAGMGHLGIHDLPESQREAVVKALKSTFDAQYYYEIQRAGTAQDLEVENAAAFADRLGVPICATHPMLFNQKSDFLGHELKICDKSGKILHDRARDRVFSPHQHFMTAQQMCDLFHDLPDAVENTETIARSCNVEIPLGKSVLPAYPLNGATSLRECLEEEAVKGLGQRMAALFPDIHEREGKLATYRARLDMELNVICKMGFEGYFLIVQDFINWAKTQGIPVGPGRGSGAGSLVAYALRITDLDPLEFNLLFERFLNPERVSMPDFDIDFCKNRREEVIAYVTAKYGKDAVAGIANINTLQARAAIKAAGRALGMRVPFVASVSNLIPAVPGQEMSIKKALETEKELQERIKGEAEASKLIEMAQCLEGLPTAIGQHAAGIVISPTIIADYSPLYLPSGKVQAVTQFDKDDIEKAGLVKFDFLGLKTLTEIQLAEKYIRQKPGHEGFDINAIKLDDKEVFKIFTTGDTLSVFQFESPGMQKLLIEARPECFGDLVALNALYRPGPMDLIPDFIKRKNGQSVVEYVDDRLIPILEETYGIMVYQEQVMQIAQAIGGYSLGGADLLRRAMGKKKVEEMAKHRAIFIAGASQRGVKEDVSGNLFDHMEKFAGYGFNKSHAAAYTLLAYQTAYIKKYHPDAFYASWMSIEGEEDTAPLPALIKDAQKHGLTILPPAINESETRFTITQENTSLRYSLNGLKGIGLDVAKGIVEERVKNGRYKNLEDVCKRLAGTANKKALEVLSKSGAMAELGPRAWQLNRMAAILKQLKKQTDIKEEEPPPTEDGEPVLEAVQHEKEAFGFYLTTHPYAHYFQTFQGLGACESPSSIEHKSIGWDQFLLAGIIEDVRILDVKNGKFLIATIGDGKTSIEVKAFSSVAKKVEQWFKKDAFALMAISIREDRLRGGKSFQITDAKGLEDAKALLAESCNILCNFEDLDIINAICQDKPGPLPVFAWHLSGTGTLIRSDNPLSYIENSDQALEALRQIFGELFNVRFKQSKPDTI